MKKPVCSLLTSFLIAAVALSLASVSFKTVASVSKAVIRQEQPQHNPRLNRGVIPHSDQLRAGVTMGDDFKINDNITVEGEVLKGEGI